MKKYIKCSKSYISDDEIIQRFAEEGIGTTSNPRNAIYILRDGTLIRGVYQGVRSEDHRCAECLLDGVDRYDLHFWDKLFEATEMVILHPEIEVALIGKGQKLTYEQQQVIDELGYWIDTL